MCGVLQHGEKCRQLEKNKSSPNNDAFTQFLSTVLCLPAHRYGTAELCFHHVLLIAQLVGALSCLSGTLIAMLKSAAPCFDDLVYVMCST